MKPTAVDGVFTGWSIATVAEWAAFAAIWALLLWGLWNLARTRLRKRFR